MHRMPDGLEQPRRFARDAEWRRSGTVAHPPSSPQSLCSTAVSPSHRPHLTAELAIGRPQQVRCFPGAVLLRAFPYPISNCIQSSKPTAGCQKSKQMIGAFGSSFGPFSGLFQTEETVRESEGL